MSPVSYIERGAAYSTRSPSDSPAAVEDTTTIVALVRLEIVYLFPVDRNLIVSPTQVVGNMPRSTVTVTVTGAPAAVLRNG